MVGVFQLLKLIFLLLCLEVYDGGCVPVLGGVDVALGRGGHHQVSVGQAALVQQGKVH